MKILGGYKNGNYNVTIFDDGTKIRENKEDYFEADFPECMDIKITNFCDMGCKYCHENSSVKGEHGDILNAEFIDTLRPFTELAIGGGNPLSHPDLMEFLKKLKEKKIIANMTVNQTHFQLHQNVINDLIRTENDLIKGLGISLTNPSDEFIEQVKQYPNAVIHVIAGVVTLEQLEKLSDNGLKILILGYKEFRRGEEYYQEHSDTVNKNIEDLKEALPTLIEKFKVVSFDNLAIEQLAVKKLMSEDEWNEFYMGDDGKFTMYIDMVNKQFARSSTSKVRYDLKPTIDEMFRAVKECLE
ncbi:MAG: radical SAM protein [Clostridia bacterium]|nr:radical SAM protein [Clostridia bacterium]